jgi:hypothetical protein
MSSLKQYWRKGQNRFCLEAKGIRRKERAGVREDNGPKQCMYI